MRIGFKLMLLFGALVILSGCSRLPQRYQFIHNSTNDYQGAASLPPLQIPPGYDSSQFKEKYPVPNANLANQPITKPDLTPPNVMGGSTINTGVF